MQFEYVTESTFRPATLNLPLSLFLALSHSLFPLFASSFSFTLSHSTVRFKDLGQLQDTIIFETLLTPNEASFNFLR
jgi:hypothetical protein